MITFEQQKLIAEVASVLSESQVIQIEGNYIINPSNSITNMEELQIIVKTLKRAPELFNTMYGPTIEADKPILLGLIPAEWYRTVDGKNLLTLGQYYSRESRTSTYNILHVVWGQGDYHYCPSSAAMLMHELHHIEFAERLVNSEHFPTFINEGIGELILKVYALSPENFLHNPIDTINNSLKNKKHLLLRKKHSLGYPLQEVTH